MGLLSEGNPLSWEETKVLTNHVREHGINQFISLYHRFKDRQGDILKWGDETEYIIVRFDDAEKVVRVALKAEDLLAKLNEKELADPEGVKSLWRPEYGAFMIEGTPGKPFTCLMTDFKLIEVNMRYRREEVTELLAANEYVMSITNFPRMGTPNFTYPIYGPNSSGPKSLKKSFYFPDEAIFSGHPRYKTGTRNISMRRGGNVCIKLKVFKDRKTQLPVEGAPPGEPDVVVLDATGYGSCCCCLQCTFQASNITEARHLYDQLAPLCPIMLAFTAATPIHAGYLTETDCRWNVLSSSVDCRTEEERGNVPLKENMFRIAKSRCDSIDSYLSPEGTKYNDVPITYDESVYKRLIESGIDHLLAQHVAHLFIRDTISLFSENVHQDDEKDTDHFENIQSTNWQTMRFKPPPMNSSIGWRVEFRPCEVQISDFENAAIVCFIVLLTRVILFYQLNFLIPFSKVDENMQTAQKRDACRKEKFWFRKSWTPTHQEQNNSTLNGGGATTNDLTNGTESDHINNDDEDPELFQLLTINEIFNGKTGVFPGLVPLMLSYLQSMKIDTDTYCTIEQYLRFIQKRAVGELVTTATWIREQVLNHPEYKNDSIVTERINYDLLKKILSLAKQSAQPTQENNSEMQDFILPASQKQLAKNG